MTDHLTDQPVAATAPLNTVTWWELPVSDLPRARDFYGPLFGWTFGSFGGNEDEYASIHHGGAMIGGLFRSDVDPATPPGVRVYVNVADLGAVLATAETLGGAVRTPPQEIGGDMGWWAEISDPDGRWIGLCADSGPQT